MWAMIPRPSSSVLKADVWRDHLLAEEVRLNVRLAELDTTPLLVNRIYMDTDGGKWARGGRGTSSWRVVDPLCEAISGHLIQIRSWIWRGGPRRANKVLFGRLAVRGVTPPKVVPK
jgi:hypothetical protein